MSLRRIRRSRPVRAGALSALVLAASTALPVVHAHAEQLVAEAAVEAHHSDRCPTLHVDVLCPTCHAGTHVAAAATRVPLERAGDMRVHPVSADLLPPASDGRRSASVRAPPIR